MDSNNIYTIIHNRRSIRKFLEKDISDEVIKKILAAGFRAPFAYQITTVIFTKDKDKMRSLQQMGVYPTTKLFLVFFIDFNRMEKIVKARKYEYNFDDSLLLWICLQDVSLVVENIILAAEAEGLGSVLLGGAPLFINEITKIFNLPPKVLPVVGLCMGYPDPNHLFDIRPRFPLKFTAFEDSYKTLSNENLEECMKAMDEGYLTQGYYIKQNAKIPLQNKNDLIDYDKYSWTEHISRKVSQGYRGEKTLIQLLREQGFHFE